MLHILLSVCRVKYRRLEGEEEGELAVLLQAGPGEGGEQTPAPRRQGKRLETLQRDRREATEVCDVIYTIILSYSYPFCTILKIPIQHKVVFTWQLCALHHCSLYSLMCYQCNVSQ